MDYDISLFHGGDSSWYIGDELMDCGIFSPAETHLSKWPASRRWKIRSF
jgi:hypothetical protein